VDWLIVFGSIAVASMLMMYWLEERGSVYVLGFAVACAASSVYGWLAGAYPFGVLEAIWAGIALRRWQRRTRLDEDVASAAARVN